MVPPSRCARFPSPAGSYAAVEQRLVAQAQLAASQRDRVVEEARATVSALRATQVELRQWVRSARGVAQKCGIQGGRWAM